MTLEINFAQLPVLPLPQREQLPQCPAIYFALDFYDRVLYVGKASNLFERWKAHHRFDQLNRIHKKTPVRLVWLDCGDRPDALVDLEAQFISHYQPLLNQTQVPAKKIIPTEVALQETLKKSAKYLFILGISPAEADRLAMVHLRYVGFKRDVHILRRIFEAINRKPTGLRWVEVVRRKTSPRWEAKCNGVILIVGFSAVTDSNALKNAAVKRMLAGVELLALTGEQLAEATLELPLILEIFPNIQPFEQDPIPLLWNNVR